MNLFGTVSYLSLAALYAVLTLLLLTSWRRNRIGGLLILACAISVAWSLVLAAQASGRPIADVRILLMEALRSGAWLVFMLAILYRARLANWVAALVATVWVAALVAGLATPLAVHYSGVGVTLCGLFLIEQLYRNTQKDARPALSMLVIGLGGMFAYDLVLHSQAIAFGVYDSATWSARGAANILFVPLIAVTARRLPQVRFDIFVSRRVVYYSASLVSVAAYLALMLIGSRLLVHYGGTWGELARIVFVTAATIALLGLLVSDGVRARVKVLLSKHFYRNKYEYRDEWLRLVSTLAGFEDSTTREIVVKAMAQIVRSPGGWLWTIDEDGRQYQLAASYQCDASVPFIAVDDPLVRFIRKEGWLVDLEEYERDRSMYGDLELPDWLAARNDAWLIVPLMFRQGLLGLVMLRKSPTLFELNYEDRDLLKTVGNHLAVHLAQERSDNLLTEARQFEAYNRLTAFLMHDLNNLIAQQSLIVENAEKHSRNPEFVDDAMRTVAGSVERMKRVMERLKRRSESRDARPTDLRDVLLAAVDRCAEHVPAPTLDVVAEGVKLRVDAELLTTVLAHLVRNAQDATDAGGQVRVSVGVREGAAVIEITDTGSGMSDEFVRERLFRPFDSTKGSQGMGIGAYQAREFARGAGGELHVESREGEGTTIRLLLPLM